MGSGDETVLRIVGMGGVVGHMTSTLSTREPLLELTEYLNRGTQIEHLNFTAYRISCGEREYHYQCLSISVHSLLMVYWHWVID